MHQRFLYNQYRSQSLNRPLSRNIGEIRYGQHHVIVIAANRDRESAAAYVDFDATLAPPAAGRSVNLLREGRRVGGYTLERQLGSGGMGEVWLARHALLARPSAVKLIRQQALQEDSSAREMLEQRFRREAQATSQLRSPHTVELYDFGVTEDGDFYYVMEYLNGIDLESLVTKYGPVGPARAVFLLSQACMSD